MFIIMLPSVGIIIRCGPGIMFAAWAGIIGQFIMAPRAIGPPGIIGQFIIVIMRIGVAVVAEVFFLTFFVFLVCVFG